MILSICIATYNRADVLKELIDSLLEINCDDFEIVVTDNCSTDDTKRIILNYTDKRIRYILNKKPIPALLNVIHSIYNAKGKYALYCNDRDVLYPQKIYKLIDFLKNQDLSFVFCPRKSRYNENLTIFEKGYDSLIHQECVHHPTGMIFNRDLMEIYLKEEEYYKYVDVIYTYDFLMLDLFKYEKSAICNLGYWGTRSTEYIGTHRAGTGSNLYFMPETRSRTFYAIVEHIFKDNIYCLTEKEKKSLLKKLYTYFAILFCNYKLCMSDKNESAHYGLQRKYISIVSMIKIYNAFFSESLEKIKNIFNYDVIKYIKKKKVKYLITLIKSCIKIDILTIAKALKN